MLNKETIFLPPYMNKWREITIGESSWSGYFGWSTGYYFPGPSWNKPFGSISDNTVEGSEIESLVSWYIGSNVSDYRRGISVSVRNWLWDALYFMKEGGTLFTLPKYRGEGYFYEISGNSTSYTVFSDEDLNKTIKVYLGTTPPLREKYRELFGLGGFSHVEQRDASLCRRNTRNGLACRRRKLDSRESSMLWEQPQPWKNYFLQWGPQSFCDSNTYEKHIHCQNKRRVFNKGRDLQKRQRNKERPFSIGKLGAFLFQRCKQNRDGVLPSFVVSNRTSILGGAVC